MTEAPKTIRDEMLASITEANLVGLGGSKMVFRFSDERLKGYVFSAQCVCSSKISEALAELRAKLSCIDSGIQLQAIDDFLGEREFGTPIMGNIENFDTSITIMPLVQGTDIRAAASAMGDEALLSALAELPQSAYTQLFKDARFLHEHGYLPDLNSGNIMLDTVREKLTIIDLDQKGQTACSDRLILSCMNYMFTGDPTFKHHTSLPSMIDNARTAFEKMIIAAEEVGLTSKSAHYNPCLVEMMKALSYTSEERKAICDRLCAVVPCADPVFQPHVTMECIAPLRMDAPASSLVTAITKIRAHHDGEHMCAGSR